MNRDEEIVNNIRSADKEVVQKTLKFVFEEYRAISIAMVTKYGGNIQDAEETFIEAITVLYENIITGKFTLKSSLKSYFLAIVRFAYINKIKKERNAKLNIEELETEPSENTFEKIEERTEQNELNNLMKESINQLGDDCKLLIFKFYFEDKKIIEIAEEMNMSVGSVKSRLYRCRSRLREILKTKTEL